MKKKLKLKPFVLPSIYLLAVFALVISIFATSKSLKEPEKEEITYVSNAIFGTTIPVMNVEDDPTVKVIRPYQKENVKIDKYFYDYQGDATKQQQSLIEHENTYMQNSGIDFVCDEAFDVIAVLDGTVIDVKEDEILGKIVEVRHGNNLISIYQSLGEVKVAKNDTIKQGQVIGTSGKSELSNHENQLHFELFSKGVIVNPENYFDKSITNQD